MSTESEDSTMDVEEAKNSRAESLGQSGIEVGSEGVEEPNEVVNEEIQLPSVAELDAEFRKYSFLRPMRRHLPLLRKKVEIRSGKHTEESTAGDAVNGANDNQSTEDMESAATANGENAVSEDDPAVAAGSEASDGMVIEESRNEEEEEEEAENAEALNSDIDSMSAATSQDSLAMPPAIAIGEFVEVASRCWPGMNKQGGAGKVKKVQWDEEEQEHLYRVQYILGGSESGIQEKYIRKRDILGGSDTGARKQGLRGRCRYCSSFIRDCGHSQEDRPVEPEDATLKLTKRRSRAYRGGSSEPEALINRLIQKQERRRGSGVGDSLARLLEWRVASGMADRSDLEGSPRPPSSRPSPPAAQRSARTPKKPAPRRFAALSSSGSGGDGAFGLSSSSSSYSSSASGSASQVVASSGAMVGREEASPAVSAGQGMSRELSPQQVSALVSGAMAATEKRTRDTLEGLYSPDDDFLRPEDEQDLGGQAPGNQSGVQSYTPLTLLSISSQCLDRLQRCLTDASTLRNRIIAFNTNLTDAAESRRRHGGGLAQLQEGVELASQIIALSDDLEVLRSVVAVGLQDRVTVCMAQWKRLGKSTDRSAAAEDVRRLKHKMKGVRGRTDILAEAWRAEEDSMKRAQKQVEGRFEQMFGLSPLDYAIEHGEDAEEGGTSEEDSGGSVFSADSDEEEEGGLLMQQQQRKRAAAGAAGGKRRQRSGGGSGNGAKRARIAPGSRPAHPGAGTSSGRAGAGDDDDDSDFEREERGPVKSSGASESRPRGHELLVNKQSGQPPFLPQPSHHRRDKGKGKDGKQVVSARGLAVRRASMEGENENRPASSSSSASSGSGGMGGYRAGAAGPPKKGAALTATSATSHGGSSTGVSRGLTKAGVVGAARRAAPSMSTRFERHFSGGGGGSGSGGGGRKGGTGPKGGPSNDKVGNRRIVRVQQARDRGEYIPRGPGSRLLLSLDPAARSKPRHSYSSSSSSSSSSSPSAHAPETRLPLFDGEAGKRRMRRSAGAAAELEHEVDLIVDDDSEEEDEEEEEDAVESFLSLRIRATKSPACSGNDKDKDEVSREDEEEGREGVESDMATLLLSLSEEAKADQGASSPSAASSGAYRLMEAALAATTHAVHAASVQLRAGGDMAGAGAGAGAGLGASSKGADSRVDRAVTLLLLLLRGSLSASSAALLPLLVPRLALFEQQVLFSLLLPSTGAPNACLLSATADPSGGGQDPLNRGSSLASLLYEATIDPLHDNLVGCALHYLSHKVRLSVAVVTALATPPPAAPVPAAAPDVAPAPHGSDDYACLEAAAACLGRAWDDLALALVVNPALVARCLKLASQEGLDGVFTPGDAAGAEGKAEVLSFKEWYRRHQHRRRAYAYDAARSLWLLRFWSSLIAASWDFSQALSKPALKALLSRGQASGRLLPTDLAAFKGDPWAPLLRRLGSLHSLSGYPYVGARLSCFPYSSNSDSGEVPVSGGDGAIASVNPYFSGVQRAASAALLQRHGTTSDSSAECLWAAIALNSLLLHQASADQAGTSVASAPRVRNAWALAELLLSKQPVAVCRGMRRVVALSGVWDESAEGARIMAMRAYGALTAARGGIPLALASQKRGVVEGQPGDKYKGALEAAAAAVIAHMSSFPSQTAPAQGSTSLQVPLGRLVAALYLESGVEVPFSLVPGSKASSPLQAAGGLYEGLDLLPACVHSFLRKSTSNADGAGQSKILVKRVLAVLRKKETSLVGLLSAVRAVSRDAAFDVAAEAEDPSSEAFAPTLVPRLRSLTLMGRATTALLLLAAASAALGAEALQSSPQAPAQEVLSVVLPWGEDEMQGGGEEVTLPREEHACLMWLVALVVHHPTALPQPGTPPPPGVHLSTGASLQVSLSPLLSLLSSLPLIIESDQRASAPTAFKRGRQALTPLSTHCTRQLLVALAASSAAVHSLASAPELTEERRDTLWSLLYGQSSLGTLVSLGFKHGPPRSGLGCIAVRACIVCLRAITRLRIAVSESEEIAQAWVKKGHAPILAHGRASFVDPLRNALPKLMSGGAEAGADYDILAAPLEEAPLSVDPLPTNGATAPARRKGHLHALAISAVAAIADWAASLCVPGGVAGTSPMADAVQIDVGGVVSSLRSVRSFDSPLSSWLEVVLWTPVMKALLVLTKRAPLQGVGAPFAPSDARLLLEESLSGLHLNYLVLVGTSVVQRNVVKTIDGSSFESSLADIALYCATDSGASKASVSARCAAFWQEAGEDRPFRGSVAPSTSSALRAMTSLSYKVSLLPTSGAQNKTEPLAAVCLTLTRFCRFVNQMAFHSVQRTREHLLLPFATDIKFRVILGAAVTAASASDWANQALVSSSRDQLLGLFEEGAGFKRDIAMAEAMLVGVDAFPDDSAAATVTSTLQYLPIVVRSCATRQYATAVRGWEPLLAMLAHACTASNLWRASRHGALYSDVLYTWAIALTDCPLSTSAASGNLGGSAVRRLMQGAGPGVAAVTGVYKHAQRALTEDGQSLEKIRGFATFVLCSRGKDQFRSDVLWRRVVSEMVSRSASDDEEEVAGAAKYTEMWLNASVVAARVRLAITRAASCAYFVAGEGGHLEVVSGDLAELHVSLVASSVIVALQLLRVLRGDALEEVDPSYSRGAAPAGNDSQRAAQELTALLELSLYSAEARAALSPAGGNDGHVDGSHAAAMQRGVLKQWRVFLNIVSRGGASVDEGEDSQGATEDGGGDLLTAVDMLSRQLRRWICCQCATLAGSSDAKACGCSVCSSPLVWEAMARHRAALEGLPESGVAASCSPHLTRIRGLLDKGKGTLVL